MFLKLIGMIIVVLSSTLIGIMLCRKLENRLKDLKTLRLGLTILGREISFLVNSISEALNNASKVGGNISIIFTECSEILNEKKGYCVKDAWEMSVNNNIKNTYLLKEDRDILISLGRNLGLYDLENQIQNINYVLAQLENQENYVKELIDKNSKMYKSLSFLAGLALSIILI